jgi:hypothetical protein
MNHILQQLEERMIENLKASIAERQEELLELAQDTSDDEETSPQICVSIRGKADLQKNQIETAFSFSKRTVIKTKAEIEDPRQMTIKGIVVRKGEA